MDSYVRGRPHPALAGLVVDYGGYREFSAEPLRRRQAPTGGCALILGLGPPLRLHGPAGPLVPTSFLAGLHESAVVTEFVGEQYGLQVNLTPLGVFTLLGRPTSDLTNLTPELDELGVPALRGLPERLRHDPDWSARFVRIDATLLGLLDAARTRPDPEVTWAWGRLVRTSGAVAVADLAAGTGWSRRHLLTRFRSQVGLAPKTTGRVLRFQRAAELLVPTLSAGGPGARGSGTIADVAAACGYADHAHLDREFRALAGCTPTEYVAGWGEFPNVQAAGPGRPYGDHMTIHATLRYDDADAALTFLTGALGLTLLDTNRDDAGQVSHATLAHEGDVVMVSARSDPPGAFDTGRAVLYLATDDVDAHHARAVAAGAPVIMELVDQPYGSREYAVTDPEGNVWSVGTYRP